MSETEGKSSLTCLLVLVDMAASKLENNDNLMKLLALAQVDASKLEDDNDKLKAENVKLREERDEWHDEQVHAFSNWRDAYLRTIKLANENANLRKRINTQKQIIQEYRDESREWREVAEQYAAELGIEVGNNDK